MISWLFKRRKKIDANDVVAWFLVQSPMVQEATLTVLTKAKNSPRYALSLRHLHTP